MCSFPHAVTMMRRVWWLHSLAALITLMGIADAIAQTRSPSARGESPPFMMAAVAPGPAGGGARVVASTDYMLRAGYALKAGEFLVSRNRAFFAIMQDDGNFAIYHGSGPYDNKGLVSDTKTGGQPNGAFYAAMQADGNFVVYRNNGQPLFDTKTYGLGNDAYAAELNDDGSLVVLKLSNSASGPAGVLWSSRLGANPAYATAGGKQIVAGNPAKAAADIAAAKATADAAAAKAAADAAIARANAAAAQAKAAADEAARLAAAPFSGGNILKTGKYLTVGQYMVSAQKKYYAIMQSDGNFCHNIGSGPQDRRGEIWCSGTNGPIGTYHAVMQRDGNFCVYKGHDPQRSEGNLWCTSGTAAGLGDYFALIQDDSNFVVYRGRGPASAQGSMWNRISAAEASRNGWDRFKDSVSNVVHTVVAGISDTATAVANGTVDAAEITASAAKNTADAAKNAADAAVAHAKLAADAAAAAAKAAADASARAAADAAAAAAAASAKAATDAANAAAKTALDGANATKNAAMVTASAADKAAAAAAEATLKVTNTVTTQVVNTANLVANDTTAVAVTVGRGVVQGGKIVGNEIVKDGKIVGYAVAKVAEDAWALLNANCGTIGRIAFPIPVSAYFKGASEISGTLAKFGTVDPKTGKTIQNFNDTANRCYEKIEDGFYCALPKELSKLVSSSGSMPGNMVNLATRVFQEAKTEACLIAGAATIGLGGTGTPICGFARVMIDDAQKAFACFTAAESKGLMKQFLAPPALSSPGASGTSGTSGSGFPSEESCRGIGELAFSVAEKVFTGGVSTEAKAALAAGRGRTVAVVADELLSIYKVAGRAEKFNRLLDELHKMQECKD